MRAELWLSVAFKPTKLTRMSTCSAYGDGHRADDARPGISKNHQKYTYFNAPSKRGFKLIILTPKMGCICFSGSYVDRGSADALQSAQLYKKETIIQWNPMVTVLLACSMCLVSGVLIANQPTC